MSEEVGHPGGYCSNCGQPREFGAKFCRKCGAALVDSPVVEDRQQQPYAGERTMVAGRTGGQLPGTFWGGTAIAVFLFGVFGAIGAGVYAWRRGSRKVAKWLVAAGVVWTAVVAAILVLELNSGPSGLQVAQWVANQYALGSVSCNMPIIWSEGTTFDCYGQVSGQTDMTVKITVLPSSNGSSQWDGSPG